MEDSRAGISPELELAYDTGRNNDPLVILCRRSNVEMRVSYAIQNELESTYVLGGHKCMEKESE